MATIVDQVMVFVISIELERERETGRIIGTSSFEGG
jgi:hypothetical protein